MKRYIGDGVYIELDEFGAYVLTTETGAATTNRIVLEPEVMDALLNYVEEERS